MAALFIAKKIINNQAETPARKVAHLAWQLAQSWKQKHHLTICRIFDSDRYSFVGGLYLE